LLASSGSGVLVAQDPGRLADGLVGGSYVRIAAGRVAPVSPEGSMKEWKPGTGVNVMFENWDNGSGGPSIIGFAFFVDYSLLPFDPQQFTVDYDPRLNGALRTSSAKRAGIFQLGINTRFRIPTPYIMPWVGVGFGFLDWRPGKISYTTASGSFTTKQQNRSGGGISFSGGLDKHIYDRWAIFGEAVYSYSITSFGQGLGASGSQCVATNCDLLKNTQLGTIRGGLRVRTSR